MREDLKYPQPEAIDSVLKKVGVEPSTRHGGFHQDAEYTSCRPEELEAYVRLYGAADTTDKEKRVLGCFILQCLNDSLEASGSAHVLQDKALSLLHSDLGIHASELEYWTKTTDPDPENWWPITVEILSWRGRLRVL